MPTTPTLFWFRRDLRLADNPALLAAVTAGAGDVVATFVIDPSLAEPAGPARVHFLRRTLESLDADVGGKLCVREGDPARELLALAEECGARSVFATRDFGPRGRERDARVGRALALHGVALRLSDSPYVVAPGTVVNKSGTPCRVFGAFRRGWEQEPVPEPLPAPRDVRWRGGDSVGLAALSRLAGTRRPWYFDSSEESPTLVPAAGELAATRQLDAFVVRVDDYERYRNEPAREGTSRLSPHLRFGSLHPRQVLHVAGGESPGRSTYRSELCWRDFYADVLWHHPGSVRANLQDALAHLRVDTDARAVERFRSWARGETGYPLVDAGMRQLLAEGWMHNRVRMVAASFLVKHLHLDWRWGARWFMWRLIDGDVASNQHGWQWSAGTGTDAAPFHRIFNPTLQGERFDPDGAYVRRYVHELATTPAPFCLQPGGGLAGAAVGYAPPLVDIAVERGEALARFAQARGAARVAP